MKLSPFFLALFVALLGRATIAADPLAPQSIILASTTSVENSGLLAHILPSFTKETGITVHVLAQGTGQALQTAARDDADLVLVHDPEAEEKFIAAGDGIDRRQIAWNDFIVVGPRSDPAHIAGTHDAVRGHAGDRQCTSTVCLARRQERHRRARTPSMACRGDRSRQSRRRIVVSRHRRRYGAALNAAQAMNAYTISDRGTWLSFGNKGDLAVLVEGDPRLLNRYDVILLNPAKHPVPKQDLARRLAQWLLSPEGQAAIGAYTVHGEQLFYPSASHPK